MAARSEVDFAVGFHDLAGRDAKVTRDPEQIERSQQDILSIPAAVATLVAAKPKRLSRFQGALIGGNDVFRSHLLQLLLIY